MFHVVVVRSGPEYDLSCPLEEQSGWEEHAAFMDGLVAEGVIVLGGPLADELHVVHVVEAESEDEIRARLAEDPWSGSHLVVDSIQPWTIRLDGRNHVPGRASD
jgi:uncharacterized protein YciI